MFSTNLELMKCIFLSWLKDGQKFKVLYLIQNCFCIILRNVNHVTSMLNPSLSYCSLITFLILTLIIVDYGRFWSVTHFSILIYGPFNTNQHTHIQMNVTGMVPLLYFPPIKNICRFIITFLVARSQRNTLKYNKLGIILDIGPFYCYKCLSSALNVCLDIFLIKKFYFGANSPV